MTRVRQSTAGIVLIVLIAAAAAVGGPQVDNVRVAFRPFQLNAPLFIAEKEGYLSRVGIAVTWVTFSFPEQEIPPLIQGLLDVGIGPTNAAYLNAVARGEKIRVVADKGHVAGRGTLANLMVRQGLRGTVRGVADLKGRKIGTALVGSAAHYALTKALTGAGVSPDQVTLVHMPLPAIVAALQNGAVDAGTLVNPLDTQAAEMGIAFSLLDMATVIPGEHINFISYGSTFLEQNRALGVRFMISYLRALKQYNEGSTPRNVAIVAEYTKIPVDIVRKSGWIAVHADGHVDVTKMRRYQDWLFEIGLINVRNPMTQVVDTSFLQQAWGILGAESR